MRLDGIHHITAITGAPQRCIDFYAGILGLGLGGQPGAVAPDEEGFAFADRSGPPAGSLAFLARPGAPAGRPGAGMVHTVVWRLRTADSLDFWARRLADAGFETARSSGPVLRFADPERLAHELVVDGWSDPPPPSAASTVPPEHALRGPAGVRAYSRAPAESADLLAGRLGFTSMDERAYLIAGPRRRATYSYDDAPQRRGTRGAGAVQLVAWACHDGDQRAWRQRVVGLGARATLIAARDGRQRFQFREPSGVLFEITTSSDPDPVPGERAEPACGRAGSTEHPGVLANGNGDAARAV
jgi:glyoxalase family protein